MHRPVHEGTRLVHVPGTPEKLADAAREHRLGLPVLFITGYAGTALHRRLAPSIEVIGKPFTLDALAAWMRAMLDVAALGGRPPPVLSGIKLQ